MAITTADLLAVLDRARSAVEARGSTTDQAAALAGAVRTAWPGIAVAACRLDGPGGTVMAAFDGAGRPSTDLAAALADVFRGHSGNAEVAGVSVQVAPLEAGGRRHGGLVAAVPSEDAKALAAAGQAAADALDRFALADELSDRDCLADLGEIVGPVTHEFNNFLNTVLLQVAVLELTAPAAMKADLQNLKCQGKHVARVVKQLQQYRRRPTKQPAAADLNRAALAAVDAVEHAPDRPDTGPRIRRAGSSGTDEVPLRLALREGLPLVPGPAADLRRLCRYLLTSAAWTVAGGGSQFLSTSPSASGAVLRLEAIGATGGALSQLLDGPIGTEGIQGLEMAACQSLVRRLGGSMRGEPVPDGEALVVELPAAGRR